MKHLIITAFFLHCLAINAGATTPANEFLDLDLSQLMRVKVTSVTKRPQELNESAAAVFVISQEDIKRSGVTSIPELFRMVPGIQVARISANKWAITSRGFNGFFANKLLVLMDGRSIYTPAFSGVYWDSQDYLLEDIDRIEVIRGPGTTMWGANAVNGVINIITKKANATIGSLVSVGGGKEEKAMTGLRYGHQLNQHNAARLYLTMHDRDSLELHNSNQDSGDNWISYQGGFRLDGNKEDEVWTIQGDLQQGDNNQHLINLSLTQPPWSYSAEDNYDTQNWNVLGRWRHNFSTNNSTTLQLYYDRAKRDEFYLDQDHHTVDLDFQHLFHTNRHHIIWGLGWRTIRSIFTNTFQVTLTPATLRHNLYSGFLQDEISLGRKVKFTLGSKVEHNDYTGIEVQPSGRLIWQVAQNQRLWGAISRAVRTPSEIESYGRMVTYVIPGITPTIVSLNGNTNYGSEKVLTYEAGYRYAPMSKLSIDLTAFYNNYDDLRATSKVGTDWQFTNKMSGFNRGLELASTWQPQHWLSMQLAYSYIKGSFTSTTDNSSAKVAEEGTPRHQLSLRSGLKFNDQWRSDLWLRYMDKLTVASTNALSSHIVVDDYLELDINLSWQMRPNLQFQLVGRNLLNASHLEFVQESFTSATEIERSLYAKANWSF